MPEPIPLSPNLIKEINDIAALDQLTPVPDQPAPEKRIPDFRPSIAPGSRLAQRNQPATAAFGACYYPDNNLKTATMTLGNWQKALSQICPGNLVAILTDVVVPVNGEMEQAGWALIWLLPEYRSDNADDLEKAIMQWQAGPAHAARGDIAVCAHSALELLVKTGYTPEQADDRMAQALDALLQLKLERADAAAPEQSDPTE